MSLVLLRRTAFSPVTAANSRIKDPNWKIFHAHLKFYVHILGSRAYLGAQFICLLSVQKKRSKVHVMHATF